MIISVAPFGNIGNRMLAYMVARALAARLPEPVKVNAQLPEWGMAFDPVLHKAVQASPDCCLFYDAAGTNLEEMAAKIAAARTGNVVLQGFFQRFWLLRDPAFYRGIFPRQPLDMPAFAEDEIVINIRAGEILGGIAAWYPVVPPAFYKTLLERTGCRPVFLGQVEDSAYMRAILQLCPGARVLQSAGMMSDFNRLRHAKRVCLAVSTFSWLAAWLSEAAAEIHYPVLGFLHPFCLPRGPFTDGGIDLTPVGDARYHYHLFPMLSAGPLAEYLDYTSQLTLLSYPVPPEFMAALSAKAAGIEAPAEGNSSRMASSYFRRYPAAAWSVAAGQFNDARQHYEAFGKHHGMVMDGGAGWLPVVRPANLATGKPALQSSVCAWSRAPDAAADAAGAVDGVVDGGYSFHTDAEESPWWQVDLGGLCRITEVRLFNRMDSPAAAMRASQVAVELSQDAQHFTEIGRYDSDQPFGGADGAPWVVRPPEGSAGRFVRVRLLRRECFHLDQVEVDGEMLVE